MIGINKKFSAAILSLVIMLAAISSANAQGYRYREDRTSKKEKTAWIAGGAIAGAVIGGLLKGKKGAIIGGALGAGAGTATVYAKDRNNDDRYEDYDRDDRYDRRYYNRNQRNDRYDRDDRDERNYRYSRSNNNGRCRR